MHHTSFSDPPAPNSDIALYPIFSGRVQRGGGWVLYSQKHKLPSDEVISEYEDLSYRSRAAYWGRRMAPLDTHLLRTPHATQVTADAICW